MLGTVKNLILEESNPQYFFELIKFSTVSLLLSLQAKIIGTEAITLSGILKFLRNLSNSS